jgi:hypothetical protein
MEIVRQTDVYRFTTNAQQRKLPATAPDLERNFSSMGRKGGLFVFPDPNVLYNWIAQRVQNDFCFIEHRTKYFKLFWDLDIGDKYLSMFKEKKIDYDKFWKYIIEKVLCALSHYIDCSADRTLFDYIYSGRTDHNHKVHIYFPNITICSEYALIIRDKALELIKADNCFGISDKCLDDILDQSVFRANGLRMLYQVKKDQTGYYVLNKEKSTYPDIPDDLVKQLQLVALRTGDQCINFDHMMNDDKLPRLDQDLIESGNNIKNYVTKDSTKKISVANDIQVQYDQEVLELPVKIEFIYQLANNLSVDRIDSYDKWCKIVFFCRNYGLTDLAHHISKKGTNYSKSEVNKRLMTRRKNKIITINRLIEWSNEDNATKHKVIMDQYNGTICYEATHDHSNNVADFSNYIDKRHKKTHAGRYNILGIQENFLSTIDIDRYNTFIIKSGTGTNKSGVCIKYITDLVEKKSFQRVSAVASRVVLVSNLLGRFEDAIYGESFNRPELLGMKSYLDIENKKQDIKKEKRIIQTPDSLIHIIDQLTQKYEVPDILFIDEIQSLYDYIITSDTLVGKRQLVFSLINDYIKRAKYVFLVDGSLTASICSQIMNIRMDRPVENIDHEDDIDDMCSDTDDEPEDIYQYIGLNTVQIIYNIQKTDTKKHYIMYSEFDWSGRIYADLDRSQKLYICTDSKDYTEAIYADLMYKYPDKRMKIYNSDTSNEDKYDLKNVNGDWIKLDVVIVSPTVLYGLDFNISHFDSVYSYCKSTIGPSSVYQQINRVRIVKSNSVYVYLKNPRNYSGLEWVTDLSKLKKDLIANESKYTTILKSLSIICHNGMTVNNNDLFTKMALQFLIISNVANNNYQDELVKCLTEYGGRVFVMINRSGRYKEQIDERTKIMNLAISPYQDISGVSGAIESKYGFADNVLKQVFDDYAEQIKDMHMVEINVLKQKYDVLCKMKKEHVDNFDILKQEINNQKIADLLIADKSTDKYDAIIHNMNNDKSGRDIMTAHYIKSVFGIYRLSENFLRSIKHMSQVDAFSKSLIYFASDDYRRGFINKHEGKEVNQYVMKTFNQMKMIQRMVGLFWPDGLLKDDRVLKIYAGEKGILSDEQSKFINEYCANKKEMGDVGNLFFNVRRKKPPSNQYSLLGLVNSVMNEFFGGFLSLNISKSTTELLNKKTIRYYKININNLSYIELVLSKDQKIFGEIVIDYIKDKMINIVCKYNNIHHGKIFNDLIDVANMYDTYAFDDVI